MSMRKQVSHGSGSSTNPRRTQQNSKVQCKCGNDAVIRTVKNGPNCGSKFYGCPLWPDTTCDMFLLIEGKSEVEELQWKMFEKDTRVKNELRQQQIAVMKCSWNNNIAKFEDE
ncbi:DNA topoisomerase 3-alpha [Bienertia sinuspersici]